MRSRVTGQHQRPRTAPADPAADRVGPLRSRVTGQHQRPRTAPADPAADRVGPLRSRVTGQHQRPRTAPAVYSPLLHPTLDVIHKVPIPFPTPGCCAPRSRERSALATPDGQSVKRWHDTPACTISTQAPPCIQRPYARRNFPKGFTYMLLR